MRVVYSGVALLLLTVAFPFACAGTPQTLGFLPAADAGPKFGASDDGGSPSLFGDGATSPQGPSGATGNCTNLACQVHSCPGGGTGAQITGQVFDPAGRDPLYNVVVYVPNSPGAKLDPIPLGVTSASCSCDALFSGSPLAVALTDAGGNFTLTGAPDGKDIPLVVQIGKWRKEITLPSVAPCTTTSAGKITLPRNFSDGAYASLPNIAVSTGGADSLECLLTRIGVDESLFTGNSGGPGIHIFQGTGFAAAGGSQLSMNALWNNLPNLLPYDIVMLSCESNPTTGVDATTAAYMASYVNQGGRVFAEHYHYAFFVDPNTGSSFPPFANGANWMNIVSGSDSYSNDIGGVIETTLPGGQPFPEGAALKAWLGGVGALSNGEIVIPSLNARHDATVAAGNLATAWVQTDPSVSPASTQYLSWDMPFDAAKNDAGVPQYCGRVVYSDMHVAGSANDYGGSTALSGNPGVVPTGCDSNAALSPVEKAIEFILFDLSSCLVPIGFTPQPPVGGPLK
jgi:hypothetical protein